jgi:hypothetical protein
MAANLEHPGLLCLGYTPQKTTHVEKRSAARSRRSSTSFGLSGGGVLTENQDRAMIGGGAKKPVELAFGAVDGRELLLFLQSMGEVPEGAV